MDDLISRQAAKNKKVYSEERHEYVVPVAELDWLPPAQPEQSSEIQDILEYLDTVLHPIISPDHWNVYSELHDMISMLPPVQPESKREWYMKGYRDAQPKWTLCSERMPEEHEWMGTKRFGTTISDEVYVTFENPKGERFCKHLSFQNGKLSGFDQSTIDAFYKGSKPIAWMPLPEPYAERKENASSR